MPRLKDLDYYNPGTDIVNIASYTLRAKIYISNSDLSTRQASLLRRMQSIQNLPFEKILQIVYKKSYYLTGTYEIQSEILGKTIKRGIFHRAVFPVGI